MSTLWWFRSGNRAWRACSVERIAITRVMRIWRGAVAGISGSRGSIAARWMRNTLGKRSPTWRGTRSAAAHCREDALDGLLDLEQWGRQFTGEYWREALDAGLRNAAMEERIREATRRGYPLGGDEFVDRISRALGRDVRPRPPGHPPKPADAAFSANGVIWCCPHLATTRGAARSSGPRAPRGGRGGSRRRGRRSAAAPTPRRT